MAPISPNTDFLDDALKNKTILPSWRSIFTRLTAPLPSIPPSPAAVNRIGIFIHSPSSQKALLNCHDPFPAPSQASKQEFEKRSAPINFTAADQSTGDALSTLPPIGELKTSALQLSKDLHIDEVSALRIVVLEHQARPSKALLAAQGGDGEFGVSGLGASLRSSLMDNEDEKAKEQKIFFNRVEVYLMERKYVIKVAAALMRAALSVKKDNVWGDIGRRFVEDVVIGESRMLEKLVDGISSRWDQNSRSRDGLPGWVKERLNGKYGEQVAHAWDRQTMLETVHILQLLFLQLYRPMEEVGGMLVMNWFNLMKSSRFLSVRKFILPAVSPEIENLHNYVMGLTAVVSLAILQIPRVEQCLKEDFSKASSTESSATPPAVGPTSPPRPEPTISDKAFYIKNPSAIKVVTNCLKEVGQIVNAGLVGMGWVVILDALQYLVRFGTDWGDGEGTPHRRGGMAVELYSTVLPTLFPTTVEVGIKNLAQMCAKSMLVTTTLLLEPSELTAETSSGHGFCLSCEEDGLRMKNVLAHLIRKIQSFMDFSGPLIAAAFLTNGVEYEELPDFRKFLEEDRRADSSSMLIDSEEENPDMVWSGSPAQKFWTDDDAIALLGRAKNRFPYEPLPFLQMIRGLATENQTTLDYLTRMTSYTQQLPPGFRDYDVVDEDADIMTIKLVTDLVLFSPRQGGIFDEDTNARGVYTSHGGIVIPRGTLGVVTSTGGSRPVVAWQFEYNALPLFGRILECTLHPEPMSSHITSPGGLGSEDGVIEIMRILTLLVASSKEAAAMLARTPGQYDLPQVLEDSSDMLGRNRDVISIMFDLLEVALNRGNTLSPMYIIGVQFVQSLVHIVPGRVWPYVARSALLEREGRGGALTKILSAVEVVKGDYTFTLTSLGLFETLVEEAVRSCAVHTGWSKALIPASKQAPAAGAGGMGISPIVQRNIILGFTRAAVDIFESFRGYKYADIAQKLELGTQLTRIFTTILDYVYGVDGSDRETKITSVLVPSAEHLVSVFLSADGSDLSHGPILGALEDGVHTPESSLYLKSLNAWVEQVVHVVKFSDILVRARVYLGSPASQFEKRLYAAAASMAKLYTASERYKQHVLELFESLVKGSGSFADEPPSLLGYLGSQCANHFVTLLAAVDKPYQDPAIEIRIWNFVTAVVSNKQQGMSILLLRGETLRQVNGAGSVAGPANKKSMLTICLEGLEDIDRLPVEKTLAMLEAVSTAQNFWSLAMDDLGKHPKFLPAVTKHVETYTIEFLPADSKDIITQKAYKIAIAAHIARILALYMHSRRPSERDEAFFKLLLPRLNFYFEKAVKIEGYRPSLHGLLQKNFEEKWAGAKLNQFKKTRLRRKDYGTDAVYDVALASKVLGFDPGWDGRPDGYRNEVEESNANLSIVQTQVDLLHAWELLAMELCDFAKNCPELTKSLLSVVETCLSENITAGLPPPIFHQISTRRCEFAFVLIRRLYSVLPSTLDLTGVFAAAWRSITNSTTDFRAALQNAEMDYYRSLLRIIYISLTSAASRPSFKATSEFSFTVLDLLDLVVCKGFRDLSHSAHTHPSKSNPQDIALLTAILQSSLQIPGITNIHPALSTHLATNDTIRAATTLYSWSMDLSSPDLAELAALFLVELSTVPIVSHQLATENTLDALLASEISNRLRDSDSPELRRIWTRGLLPLALNLLASIGANVGREVLAFLKHFRALLASGVEFWRKPQIVMRENVDEAVKIAMIWAVVRRLGGGKELEQLVVDISVMEEGVAYLLSHRNYLRSLVVEEGEEAVKDVEKGLGVVGELLVEEEGGAMEE